jgi:apolipoprotein N-acyltransferase
MGRKETRNRNQPSKMLVAIATDSSQSDRPVPWRSSIWLPYGVALLLALAFPPFSLWPIAWLAVGLLTCWVQEKKPLTRRQWWHCWLAAVLLWLWLLQGIRLAFWPLYFGWIALSAYLAIYLPLTLAAARALHHHRRWPVWLAVPTAWAGMELLRGYLLTGFTGCMLAHTLADHPKWLQAASHVGAYGVSFWMAMVASSLSDSLMSLLRERSSNPSSPTPSRQWLRPWIPLGVALGTLGLVWGHGQMAMVDAPSESEADPVLRIAVVQENAPTMFETNRQRNIDAWESYWKGTVEAFERFGKVDLVVWPESVFTANEPLVERQEGARLPEELKAQNWDERTMVAFGQAMGLAYQEKMLRLANAQRSAFATRGESFDPAIPTWLIAGTDHLTFTPEGMERANGAFAAPIDGRADRTLPEAIYHKHHLVMFGEYIPLLHWFPDLHRALGLAPLKAGSVDRAWQIGKASLVPSICFETMVPHRIRRQLAEVRRQQAIEPDLLVNVTNDGWFRGSTMLDHHLASATLAAVENRKDLVVAANSGLSAWIDSSGRRRQVIGRMQSGQILAEPLADRRWGLWRQIGDWPAWICFAFSSWAMFHQWKKEKRT